MPCHPGQRVETSRHSFVAQGEGRTTHCPYWKQLNQQKQCRQPPAGHGHARAGLDDADIGQAAQHVGVVVCAALICAALRRGRCCCAVLRRGRCRATVRCGRQAAQQLWRELGRLRTQAN